MSTSGGCSQVVAVLGRGVLGGDEPFVHADDLGLTRGDGCFDATLVRDASDNGDGSVVLHLDAHVARLARSAAALGIEPPQARAWAALVEEAVAAWRAGGGRGEATLKLVLTRGREFAQGAGPGGTLGYLTLTPPARTTFARTDGIDVVTLCRGVASDAFRDAPWLLGGVKTLSYAVNMAAQREAAARGADDALFVSTDGYALEGTTSALVVLADGTLATTPTGATGILASITQSVIFDAAPGAGLVVRETLLRPADLAAAQCSWLVSSVRGVAPIRSLDGQPMPVDAEATVLLSRLAGFAD